MYALLIGINAYHQPGVEAGKKAASAILDVRRSVTDFLKSKAGKSFNSIQISEAIDKPDKAVWVYKILENLSINESQTISRESKGTPFEDLFIHK